MLFPTRAFSPCPRQSAFCAATLFPLSWRLALFPIVREREALSLIEFRDHHILSRVGVAHVCLAAARR